MEGKKFKFFLQRTGLSYKQFGKNQFIQKSRETIRRWTEQKEVGAVYVKILYDLIGKKLYDEIEAEWVKEQERRQKRSSS